MSTCSHRLVVSWLDLSGLEGGILCIDDDYQARIASIMGSAGSLSDHLKPATPRVRVRST